MKFFRLFLLFFLLLPFVNAQVEPKLVGSSVVQVQLNWDIDLGGQTPNSFSFTGFSFINTSTQTVSFTTTVPFTQSTDEFGNSLLTFQLNPAMQSQRVSMLAKISANSESGFEQVQGDLAKFLEQSQYVLITAQISAKAREIVAKETNPLKKAALLTSWVHNNVVYDLAYQDSILSSQQVFDIRRGVCNEYSHLLLAMLRSEGIPARFAAGFVYSGEIWAPHAWVEATINGKWYSFDPTYNEGILLDSTHLKFASGVDQGDVTEQLSALGNIDLSRVSLSRSHEVFLLSHDSFSQEPILTLFLTNETVQANSIQNVSISIQSTRPEVTVYPLSINVPKEIEVLTDKTTLLLLFPGEKRTISWSVLIPPNLQEGYLYTYPVIIQSLGAKVQGNLQAQKGQSTIFSALQVKEVRMQDKTLIISIQNAGNYPFTNAIVKIELPQNDLLSLSTNFSLDPGKRIELAFKVNELNLSSKINGNITIQAGNYSIIQPFLLEQANKIEPTRPAFNIQAEKRSTVQQSLFEQYSEQIPYAAIILILLLFIFMKLMR